MWCMLLYHLQQGIGIRIQRICCAYGPRNVTDLVKLKSFLQTRKEHFALPGSGDKKENGETPYGLTPAYAAYEPVVQENLPIL
ncbi:hypothetical protein AVEN_213169-1 [Araneus ventricosus]|uniref:Uncharacterized protein n=1 Tax=Araneus ventricosus TaxID=182803 RepID=A0A4Y2I4T3_ARAVE|nr:hypothetical protein AVEN_213169-1 [Araneus ventricosus]